MKNFFIILISLVAISCFILNFVFAPPVVKQEKPVEMESGSAYEFNYKVVKINDRYYIATHVHYGYVIGPEVPTVNPNVSILP